MLTVSGSDDRQSHKDRRWRADTFANFTRGKCLTDRQDAIAIAIDQHCAAAAVQN